MAATPAEDTSKAVETEAEAAPTQIAASSAGPAAPPAVDLGNYKVWNPPGGSAGTPASLEALPDSYFEPTAEELKSAFQSQSRLVDRLSNAPLKTEAIRQRETKEKLARWPETRIRVKFPNQLQLERAFPSKDTIKAIYAFVRSCLTDEAKPNKFILYQAPRRELKVSDPAVKQLSLAALGLAPSSVLHLTFVEESLNGSTTIPPLLPEILAKAEDLPPPPTFDPPPSTDAKGKGRALGGGGSSSSSGDSKLPKWLKLGKK
ncbi:hypothetical protein M407DRAFT_243033 [Tulasnella calospora MUT 4182]|uniref:UBX domain-containing protein n=1 Tax=Tulasnella calospora MUT 4182 TaxID=1051891 RepID=A0A0C3L3R6_9AGAM|nr:hypothetical protein M407DRAFT_243033 [Tulasnella calospora MUT 4182]